MPQRLPRSTADFKEMRRIDRRERTYYVDKTPLIDAILQDNAVSLLITRPIGFMKSTNLSMLGYFFDIVHAEENASLFDDLAIKTNPQYLATWQKHQGKHPVVYLSFKDVKGENWDTLYSKIVQQIQKMYEQHQHIFETSPRLSNTNKEHCLAIINNTVFQLPQQYPYLTTQEQLARIDVLYCNALAMLIEALHQHYQRKVVVLIDDYDVPLHSAYQHTAAQYKDLTISEISSLPKEQQDQCYFNKTKEWMTQFLQSALKDNDTQVSTSVITGVLQITFTDIIASFNNVSMHSVLSYKFADYFGFTEAELIELCTDMGLTADPNFSLATIKAWYSGYQIGCTTLYNPWSVANYITTYQEASQLPDPQFFINSQPRPYWLQTYDSSVIDNYSRKYFYSIQENLIQLLKNNKGSPFFEIPSITEGEKEKQKTHETMVDLDEQTVFRNLNRNDSSALWGLLLHTGYLTVKSMQFIKGSVFHCAIALPNYEVSDTYRNFIKTWFNEANLKKNIQFEKMLNSLIDGDFVYFEKNLRDFILNVASYFNIPKEPHVKKRKLENGSVEENIIVTPEQVYHMFMIGFLSYLHGTSYRLSSHRKSGLGCYDLTLIPANPKKHGIIFEFKRAKTPEQIEKHSKEAEALLQISEKKYETTLIGFGVTYGLHIGLSFCGKEIELKHEWCSYEKLLDLSTYSSSSVPSPLRDDDSSNINRPTSHQNIPVLLGQLSAGETVHFEIHPTLGDGNCGFYAIPIAGDREAVRRLLLENAENPAIRALVAPEIYDVVISGHLPPNIPDYEHYAAWRLLFMALQTMPASPAQIDQHLTSLRNYTQTEEAFRNFVNYDIGGNGRLAYYTAAENTSTLDAIAQLANLRIFIYQRYTETNSLQLMTIRGNENGTPTYLHHHVGTDTHFELMSIVNTNPIVHPSISNTSSSSTTFFTPLPSSSSNLAVPSAEKQSTEDSPSLDLQ